MSSKKQIKRENIDLTTTGLRFLQPIITWNIYFLIYNIIKQGIETMNEYGGRIEHPGRFKLDTFVA